LVTTAVHTAYEAMRNSGMGDLANLTNKEVESEYPLSGPNRV
jgi:hypothetical protein